MKFASLAVVLALGAGGVSADCKKPAPVAKSDMHRALSTTHSAKRFGGKNHLEISQKINKALSSSDAPVQDCSAMSVEEIQHLIREMYCHFSDELAAAYDENDGRSRWFESLEHLEKIWAEEADLVAEATEAMRDAKCAEALMLWTHHVGEEGKNTLINEQGVVLPTLPVFNETHASHENEDVKKAYVSSFTCQSGHGMSEATEDGSDHVFPHWPTEVHYTGTGYGAYPFWAGGDGTGGSGPIEVWWSEKQAAELFYHESCYMNEVGYGTGSTPCYHLMTGTLGSAKGYLYSADGEFCCESTGSPEDLAPPQSDFMDDMTLASSTSTIETAYYSGEAKWYTMTLGNSEAVTAFWYATTPEGYPLQQGEGGYGPDDPSGRGIFIYHEYNYTKFIETAGEEIDPSVFEVPAICQSTSNTCTFP